jgi:DNA-binding beta-propeller fold protein YncE
MSILRASIAIALMTLSIAAPAAPSADDYFRPRNRHLLYVTLPGTLEGSAYRNGIGIVVLDAGDRYSFVKRIPTWDAPASMSPEQVAGVTASPVTNMIYIATRGRLGAIDLATDKMVWSNTYDGQCCERPQITPNGKVLVVGANLKDFWYAIDGRSGKLLAKIQAPQSPDSHNLNLSPDGKMAFMSANGKVLSIADLGTFKTVKTITFGDNVRPFVINHDASRIYANTNNLLGFEIADVKAAKVIQHIEVPAYLWQAKWNAPNRLPVPHGCPSHGIALTPDEKEVWVVDGLNDAIHVFDNARETPVLLESINMTAGPFWITMGLDGRYAYVSSGDIVDVKTHRIVGQMKDEYGRQMASEKLLDMMFSNGKLQRVANQFGNGLAEAVARAGAQAD